MRGYDAMRASMHVNQEMGTPSRSSGVVSRGGVAPVAVIYPCCLLAVFAAVLGAPATAALGKLSLKLLPLATLVVSTLANAAS